MKNKIKKIMTATVISAMSLVAVGTAANSQNNDKNNEKSVQNYLISQNIEKTSALVPNKNIGKIVETSSNQIRYETSDKQIQFLNNNIGEAEIESNITLPQKISGLNLFVLSTTPYVSFTNDNNELKINVNFLENKTTETQSSSLNLEDKEKLNTYNLKRSILLIYANEIYNNNITLSNENKNEISTHIETISSTNEIESNSNIDNKISAIDSIINIIESNLTPSSAYYQRNISSNINNLLNNNQTTIDKINETSSNQDIANKIACALNGKCSSSQSNSVESNQLKQRNLLNNTNNLTNQITNTTEYQNNIQNNNLNNQNAYRRNNLRNRNRRRNNRIIHNENINSNANEIMENRINNQNNITNNLRDNSIMQESKTMRADRTNESISQEKYTNTNTQNETNRASRMPYETTNNFPR